MTMLYREEAARTMREAYDNGLLGFQVDAEKCEYSYEDRKPGAGCAIGVCLAPNVREFWHSYLAKTSEDGATTLDAAMGLGWFKIDDDDDDWFVKAQIMHDRAVHDRVNRRKRISDFLRHIDHPDGATLAVGEDP